MINREMYIKKLLDLRDIGTAKLITGVKRCGKSTIADSFIKKLIGGGVSKNNIMHIYADRLFGTDINNGAELCDYIKAHLPKKDRSYLFIDEPSRLPGWQSELFRLAATADIDLYIISSNRCIFETDYEGMLSSIPHEARINVFPLSYREYIENTHFSSGTTALEKSEMYSLNGGMPELCGITDKNLSETRRNDICASIMLGELLETNKINDCLLLKSLVTILAQNTGNRLSPNKISAETYRFCSSNDKKPASKTIEAYIELLKNAFVFHGAERLDVKNGRFLKTLGKYYCIDSGIRSALAVNGSVDCRGRYEELVFIELLRRGYTAAVGKSGENEISFTAKKGKSTLYIQVTEEMETAENAKRTIAPLLKIRGETEKIIISGSPSMYMSREGIKQKRITDFLSENW